MTPRERAEALEALFASLQKCSVFGCGRKATHGTVSAAVHCDDHTDPLSSTSYEFEYAAAVRTLERGPVEAAAGVQTSSQCRAMGLFSLRHRSDGWGVTGPDGIVAVVTPHRSVAVEYVRTCAAPIAAAIESALAEQAAGEAERVREAVAREREACAVLCETWTNVYPGASYARGCAARIRARATSPAPCVCGCPASEHDARNIVGEIERDCAAHGCERYYDSTCTLGEPAPEPVAAERAVIEAAVAWRASLDGPGECWHEARMREAVDVLAAARKGGGT